MSSAHSNDSIVRQLSSGLLSGTVIGVLNSRGQYLLSYLTFTSIGLLDLAYHWNYLQAHLTHLTYENTPSQRSLRSRLNDVQRTVQRELRDPGEDLHQEFRWIWSDIRRHIDGHIYYGMGFTLAVLLTSALARRSFS